MWQRINDNQDWILIILGAILIIFAGLNLINSIPKYSIEDFNVTPAIDQAGFAPIFIPEGSGEAVDGSQLSGPPIIPERIIIDEIGLDAPVITAESINVDIDGDDVVQFLVPEKFAAGWHEGSAPLGVPGNTVISGHHNAFGEVFADLVDVKVGDNFSLIGGGEEFEYVIANKMILPEKEEPLEVRLENARWILRSSDERVTLITCWPEDSNTHRLILVAVPTEDDLEDSSITQTPPISLITPAISLLISETETPVPENNQENQDFIVRNTSGFFVNIRKIPDLNGEKLASFISGDEAAGLGRTEKGDWILIRYEDIEGWVSTEVVEISSSLDSLPIVTP